MNNFLIEEFKKLGATDQTAIIAAQVYLELCEVKRYWSPSYEFNPTLQKITIKAKRKPSEDFSTFLPIPSYETLSFAKLQQFVNGCSVGSVFLAIVHADSTCVFYKVSDGLEEPTEISPKHLKVNKQEKLDADLRKHRSLIEQAALLGIPITIPKDKPAGDSVAGSSCLNGP